MGSDWLSKVVSRLDGFRDAPQSEADLAAMLERDRNLRLNADADAVRHHEEWVHWFETVEAKDAEIARLRTALEWYADTIRRERPGGGSGAGLKHYCARQLANDGGERAREALGRELLYRFSGGKDA